MPDARIISASRRTDLPGFHAAWLAARLRGLRVPVHSVFFWTRFPRPFVAPGPLRDALQALENPFVHLTVTGLGGSDLEPHVPSTEQILRDLPSLIAAFRDQPERVLWRCDPIIDGRHTVAGFAALAARFAALGIRRCTISLPATRSLKGDLGPQLAAAGVVPWAPARGRDFVAALADAAAPYGVRLAACATPVLDPLVAAGVIDRAQCVSAELSSRFHPRGHGITLAKDPHQRRACTCVISYDLGSYSEHRCRAGCAYCYSSAGGPEAWRKPGGTPDSP